LKVQGQRFESQPVIETCCQLSLSQAPAGTGFYRMEPTQPVNLSTTSMNATGNDQLFFPFEEAAFLFAMLDCRIFCILRRQSLKIEATAYFRV